MDERTCTAEECAQPAYSLGLCRLHYNRRYRAIRMANAAPCSVDGCDKPTKARGMCQTHYWRMSHRRSLDDPPKPKLRYVMGDGYAMLAVDPSHPLAAGKRVEYGKVRVLEHRAILYGILGPGPHRCYWCSASVDWLPARHPNELTVDHLNWDKADNSETNLVPSCRPCNMKRQKRASGSRLAD